MFKVISFYFKFLNTKCSVFFIEIKKKSFTGKPTVLKAKYHINETNTIFSFDILSFPAPSRNVTIKECEMGKRETVVRADTVLTFLTVSLNNSNYQINGYQMNVSLMTKNNYPCIEVYFSNKYGNVSIPFHMKANVNNSEIGGTIRKQAQQNGATVLFVRICIITLLCLN